MRSPWTTQQTRPTAWCARRLQAGVTEHQALGHQRRLPLGLTLLSPPA